MSENFDLYETEPEKLKALGSGNVTVTLSLD